MEEKKTKKKWLKTFQFLAAYLVASWTFLQFIDWILNRYSISPHWVDVLLWLFIGIIPSLLIYLYHQERINKRILKLREKIIFPLNIVLLMLVIYFGFGNSDLGATTKSIAYENELGEKKTTLITKEEFRVGIPIFNFEQLDSDATTAWLKYGIGALLVEDLLQNKNISPDYNYFDSTIDKIREASLFNDFYVDGSYKKNGDDFEITTNIRKANNAKILKTQTFKGPNILALLDDISVFITKQSGFIESNSVQYLDFPINEFMSKSLPALEAYCNFDYRKAYDIDSTFALAYLQQAKVSSAYNHSKIETQDIIDKAFALKNELPLQKQLEVYIQRNLAYNQFDDAEEQVNLQLEVDPNNDFYNRVLFSIYGQTKQIEKDEETSLKLFNENPNKITGENLIRAATISGKDDYILENLKPFELINPFVKAFKVNPLLHKGDIDTAENLIKELKLQYSFFENKIAPFELAINYLKTHTPKTNELEQFTGRYRSIHSEQTIEFWIDNNRIIQYVNNQKMMAYIPAGPNSIVGGFIPENTFKYEAVKNQTGKVIALKVNQYFKNNVSSYLYWKLDNSITAADNAFEHGNYEEAQQLYAIAIKNNPENSYLKNVLAHVSYLTTNDAENILQQNLKYVGNYGPRNFWTEGGKFYYKRKGENSELSKVELLPISENTYMNMTRLDVIMIFEMPTKKPIVSIASQYNLDSKEWTLIDSENNIFPKDQ